MRSTRRKVHRSDVNAKEIISAARKLGVFVIPIGRPVDLLCGISQRWWLIELKTAKGKYTEDQKEFMGTCEVNGLPLLTWRSVEDVIAAVNSIKAYIEVSHGNTRNRTDLVRVAASGGTERDLAR